MVGKKIKRKMFQSVGVPSVKSHWATTTSARSGVLSTSSRAATAQLGHLPAQPEVPMFWPFTERLSVPLRSLLNFCYQ